MQATNTVVSYFHAPTQDVYMMRTMMNKWIALLVTAAMACVAQAQQLQKMQQKHPMDDAVHLQYGRELRFYMQDSLPMAEAIIQQDLMLLSEKTAALFTRNRVFHSGFNELLSMDAHTLAPDGKKKLPVTEKKTTVATRDAIFYDDLKETSFDYPALQAGSTAQLRYVIKHKEIRLLTPFIYASSLPAERLTYTVTVPDGIEIGYILRNEADAKFNFSKERKKNNTIYRWEMKDAKFPQHFGDAPDHYYYTPHIIVYVKNYTYAGKKHQVFGTVSDLYRWNAGFLKELNQQPDATLQAITDSLTKGLSSNQQKMSAIYKWVQSNIRYVAFEDGLEGFRPRQAAEVCSKRYGDCKDMSSIITQMLRMANVESYYAWIGTRDLPYSYHEVPLPMVDNHMISVARVDDQWYFLDGTAPHALTNLPPYHLQGKETLLAIDDTTYKILTVPVQEASTTTLIDSTYIQITDGGIKGRGRIQYNGYFAADVWDALLYRNERNRQDFVKSKLVRGSNKYLLGQYNIAGGSEHNRAEITADFEIPGYGKKIGNAYYINLNLGRIFENQTIDTTKRKVARSFDFKNTIEVHHILDIPEGYAVSYKPKDYTAETPFYTMEIKYTQSANQVIATQRLQNKTLALHPQDFVEWNQPLAALQAQYKEQIVLEKK